MGKKMQAKTPPPPLPSFPLKMRIFYVVVNIIIRLLKRSDGGINRTILSFLASTVPPNPIRGADGVATTDHVVNPVTSLSLRHYSPSPKQLSHAPVPTIVYFHGGGFLVGSATDSRFDGFCRRLSRSVQAHVVSVEYRLAPEHRYPAPCDDGAEVLRWLDSGKHLDVDVSAVFLAGDSAGGNIAHHVARRAVKESYERAKIVGLISIQPFFGGEMDTDSEKRLPFVSRENVKWLWRSYLPEGSDCDHEAANVFGPGGSAGSVAGDWSVFPATMVVIGGLDSFQDRQSWYYRGLRKMGVRVCLVEYPNAIHSFHVFPEITESSLLLRDVGDFVQMQSGVKKM